MDTFTSFPDGFEAYLAHGQACHPPLGPSMSSCKLAISIVAFLDGLVTFNAISSCPADIVD